MHAAQQAVTGSDVRGAGGVLPLFEAHRRRAYQFAFQLTGNMDDALDVVQEAFLRLHRSRERLTDDDHVVRWLFRAIRNLAIDLLRTRSARPECEISPDLADSRQITPDQNAIRDQVAERLWAEIARLPITEREAVLLRDWHGMSYSEIAELTGATVTTVTWRIHEARTTLRERLRRYL